MRSFYVDSAREYHPINFVPVNSVSLTNRQVALSSLLPPWIKDAGYSNSNSISKVNSLPCSALFVMHADYETHVPLPLAFSWVWPMINTSRRLRVASLGINASTPSLLLYYISERVCGSPCLHHSLGDLTSMAPAFPGPQGSFSSHCPLCSRVGDNFLLLEVPDGASSSISGSPNSAHNSVNSPYGNVSQLNSWTHFFFFCWDPSSIDNEMGSDSHTFVSSHFKTIL